MHIQKRLQAAFTTIEIVLCIVLVGIGSVGAYKGYRAVTARSELSAVSEVAKQFNISTQGFIGAGGSIASSLSASETLKLLQTPVDSTSRKQGFGNFPVLDFHYSLRAATEQDGVRLAYTFDNSRKYPIWEVARSGGYVVEKLASATEPTVANWQDRVARAGQVAAVNSNWIWDYKKDPAKSTGNDGSGTVVYKEPVARDITISGPKKIVSPGTYYWVADSADMGSMTLNVVNTNGLSDTLKYVTPVIREGQQVASAPISFKSGQNGTFEIRVSRKTALGGTVSATYVVVVCVPVKGNITFSGPTTITDSNEYTWKASSTSEDPIHTFIISGDSASGIGSTTATSATSVETSKTTFPAGTNKTFIISADADGEKKDLQVTVNVPSSGNTFSWVVTADDVPTTPIVGYRITITRADGTVINLPAKGTVSTESYAPVITKTTGSGTPGTCASFTTVLGVGQYTICAYAKPEGAAEINAKPSNLTLNVIE